VAVPTQKTIRRQLTDGREKAIPSRHHVKVSVNPVAHVKCDGFKRNNNKGSDMVDPELLKILVCPENKTPVALADDALIASLNAAIEQGTLKNRAGEKVEEKFDGGLVREDKVYLYPIRDDIPIMLIDEAIPLEKA
jgi:uncharacterized protein YbaR (Trm112 family)